MCPFESGGQEAAVKGIPVEVEKKLLGAWLGVRDEAAHRLRCSELEGNLELIKSIPTSMSQVGKRG